MYYPYVERSHKGMYYEQGTRTAGFFFFFLTQGLDGALKRQPDAVSVRKQELSGGYGSFGNACNDRAYISHDPPQKAQSELAIRKAENNLILNTENSELERADCWITIPCSEISIYTWVLRLFTRSSSESYPVAVGFSIFEILRFVKARHL